MNIPTAGEGITKAAAARRAQGRQAESMKEGGGERERARWRDIGWLLPLIVQGDSTHSPSLSQSRLVLQCVGVRFDF